MLERYTDRKRRKTQPSLKRKEKVSKEIHTLSDITIGYAYTAENGNAVTHHAKHPHHLHTLNNASYRVSPENPQKSVDCVSYVEMVSFRSYCII